MFGTSPFCDNKVFDVTSARHISTCCIYRILQILSIFLIRLFRHMSVAMRNLVCLMTTGSLSVQRNTSMNKLNIFARFAL